MNVWEINVLKEGYKNVDYRDGVWKTMKYLGNVLYSSAILFKIFTFYYFSVEEAAHFHFFVHKIKL